MMSDTGGQTVTEDGNCVKEQDGNVWNRLPGPKAQINFSKLFLLLMANAEQHA